MTDFVTTPERNGTTPHGSLFQFGYRVHHAGACDRWPTC